MAHDDDIVAANFTTKKTLLRINRRRRAAGKEPIPVQRPTEKDKGLSNIQKLYLTGGVLDTFSIIVGNMGRASAIRARGKVEEASFVENSRRLKAAAKDAIKRGSKEAANFIRSIRKFEGSQVTAMAAQNIDVTRGTAADIRQETIETGLEDLATIRTNKYREAFGFKAKALEQEGAARLSRIARKGGEKQARLLGISRAAQSVVNTATNIEKAGSA